MVKVPKICTDKKKMLADSKYNSTMDIEHPELLGDSHFTSGWGNKVKFN
jgi:hypothetical protein